MSTCKKHPNQLTPDHLELMAALVDESIHNHAGENDLSLDHIGNLFDLRKALAASRGPVAPKKTRTRKAKGEPAFVIVDSPRPDDNEIEGSPA